MAPLQQRIGFILITTLFINPDKWSVSAGFGAIFERNTINYYLLSNGDPLTYTLMPRDVTKTPGWSSNPDGNETLPIALVIHGMGGEKNSTSTQTVGKALLDSYRKWNLIAVDYSKAIGSSDYLQAVSKVLAIAKKIAKWLIELINEGNVSPEKITLIGFSLGSHVAGITGKLLQSYNFTVGKIVGLDPALPGFESATDGERLSKDDADHVIVIHTTGGNVAFAEPLGDIDFYPNGGTDPQPIHFAAYKYLVESIRSGGFEATKCEDWYSYEKGKCDGNPTSFMNIDVDKSAEGKFYLKTRSESPYGDIMVADDPVENESVTIIPTKTTVTDTKGGSTQSYNINCFNILLLISLVWICL